MSLLFPKPTRKPKKPKPLKRRNSLQKLFKALTRKKPLKRSSKKIKPRSKFNAHGDNPLKNYRRRFTDYQVMVRAEIARQARLRDRTRAEILFCGMLDGMGVLYESEAIFQNGDRWVLIDAYVKSAKVAFELDGSAHDNQKGYDQGRDAWLLRVYGIRTVRFTNSFVYKGGNALKQAVEAALARSLVR